MSDSDDDGIIIKHTKDRFELRAYKAVPNSQRMQCSTCRYLHGYVSWWCANEEARIERNTALPTAINCPYWDHPCFNSN